MYNPVLVGTKKKNEAAASLARKRWSKTTKAERTEIASGMAKSRWDQSTKADRAAIGKRLAEARAAKKKAKS